MQRKLVAVISAVTQEALLAGQILSLSAGRHLDVVLLGVVDSLEQEAKLRRRLIIIAAFLRDAGTRVEIRIEQSRNWIHGLHAMVGATDVLACSVGDCVGTCGAQISEALASEVQLPVHILSAPEGTRAPRRSVSARLAPWLGSTAIILGFMWLQLQILQLANDTVSSLMLIVSLPAEIGLIWLWNSLIG